MNDRDHLELVRIAGRLQSVEQDVAGLTSDMTQVKNDVADIKKDMVYMKGQIDVIVKLLSSVVSLI